MSSNAREVRMVSVGPLELRPVSGGVEVAVVDYHAGRTVLPVAMVRALLDMAENVGPESPGSQLGFEGASES